MNATRICSVNGCERPFSCKDMCELHYGRMRRTGSTDIQRKYPNGAVCAVDGCDSPRRGREWCGAHWLRWRKYGDPLGNGGVNGVDWNVKRDCGVEGCDQKAHAHRMCHKHLSRWRKHGDPHFVAKVTGRPLKGDKPSWAAIHKRLQRSCGKASERACVDCGGQAREWSYRGGCPNEMFGTVGSFVLAYTEDLSFYDPRCTSCHRKYDDAGARDRDESGRFEKRSA